MEWKMVMRIVFAGRFIISHPMVILVGWLHVCIKILFKIPLENIALEHMESSPLLVKGCKIVTFDLLSRKGSLTCHTCFDTGPRFRRSHPLGRFVRQARVVKIYLIKIRSFDPLP